MARKKRVKNSTTKTPTKVDKEVTNLNESSSDDEMYGDLASLASRVAKEIKEKLTPSTCSSTRVVNLRNRTLSFSNEDNSAGFVIDKLPSSVENNFSTRSLVTDQEEKKTSDSKMSDNKTCPVEYDSSDDESDEEVMYLETNRNEGKTEFERLNLSSALEADLDTDLYVDLDNYRLPHKKSKPVLDRTHEEVMKKSVLTPDFEKKHEIPPYSESVRQTKKRRQAEKAKSKGKNWFDMKAPEMTEEMKNDLTIIQNRNVLDPKHFYKAPDRKVLPKFFQFGKVVDDPVDFYNGRVPKKQRKRTLVDELLADADLRRYNKKKYTEVVMAKARRTGAYGDIKFSKKIKKKKK